MIALRNTAWLGVVLLLGCGGGHGHREHDGMTHDFSDAERWSKHFDDPARDAWQRPTEVIDLMRIEPGMTVVDLGAGTGYFLPHLSEAAGPDGEVLALDVEQSLVDHMAERADREGLGNVTARVIPPDDPQIEDGSVDRVLVVNTWHHLPDRNTYAARLRSALRDGGAVYIVDITEESENGPHKEHRIPAVTVAETLRDAGLDATVLEETLPEQYVVRGAR